MAMTLLIIYLTGLLPAYWMLRVSYKSEQEVYTIGAMALTCLLSVLSWLIILIILIGAWVEKIAATGYWKRPLKETPPETKTPEAK